MEKKTKSATPATVDEYLAALPPDVRKALERLRTAIKAAVPEAIEAISYGMPGYKYLGRPLIYFAAQRKHCGLYSVNTRIKTLLAEDLAGFDVEASTIRFTPEKPLPVSLIKKIVKLRMKENEERAAAKKAARAAPVKKKP